MSCPNHFLGHFLIVDIGHPMTHDTILLIKKSIQNILMLACNIRDVSRIPAFGYGVLAPSFQVIQEWKILTGNFPIIDNNLQYLENPSNIGAKVTLRDYRSFLESSIENIVADFDYYRREWKSKTETKEKFNPLYYWPSQMQITLITKKGGSLILEILKKFQNYSNHLHKIEIVELSNNEEENAPRNELNFIYYSIITEDVYDLDGTFKKWILGGDTLNEEVKIILNRNTGFHIKCNINDCLINPEVTTLPNTFSLSATYSNFITRKLLHSPAVKSIHEMEAVGKIGISDVCPSMIFGLPKWLYPRRTCITNWDEFHYNSEIFRALCAQLCTAEIGLLARLKPSSRFNKISPLYFIISDGMRLLMKNIVPVELRLPLSAEHLVEPQNDIEEEANGIVHSLIGRLEMQKLSYEKLSTGVYNHFRDQLIPEGLKANTVKAGSEFISKREKTHHHPDIPPGEYTPKFLLESRQPDETRSTKGNKSNIKTGNRKEEEPIHPALMSPETMAKYRKHGTNRYQLPEVMEPGVLEK